MRLSNYRYLKLISRSLTSNSNKSVRGEALSVAQIHATILTIIIAIISTATIYYLNLLRESELKVFDAASEINQLIFPISFVYPSSSFPFPKNIDDSVELSECLLYLLYDTDTNNIDKAKNIYSILNVITHRYPFPEYPVEKSNLFNEISLIQFRDIEHIRKWSKELKKIYRKLYFPLEVLINHPQIGNDLLKSSDPLAKLAKLTSYPDFIGRTDLHSVEKEIKSKLIKAADIAKLVGYKIRGYDEIKKSFFDPFITILLFVSGIIAFVSGVIYPISCQFPKKFWYVYIPMVFYLSIILLLVSIFFLSNLKLTDLNIRTPIFFSKENYFNRLGDLPGGKYSSRALGISPDGSVVVGSSISSHGLEAFRWTYGTGMIGLGDLPGGIYKSVARAAANKGLAIIGDSASANSGPNEEAFLWTEQRGMTGLGDLPGDPFRSNAFSISTDGKFIVGRSWISGSDQIAFLWTLKDGMVDIAASPGNSNVSEAFGISNDGSTVTGWIAKTKKRTEAFRWTKETGIITLGGLKEGIDKIFTADSFGYNISGDGSTVVGKAGICGKAFIWNAELGMIAISGCGGSANATSLDGSIVVGKVNDLERDIAFIWDHEKGTRNLEDVLINDFGLDLKGFKLTEASDISDDGKIIVGKGINPDGFEEAWMANISIVPNPKKSILLVFGLLGLFAVLGLIGFKRFKKIK